MVSESWRESISLKFLLDESIKIISVFENQQYRKYRVDYNGGGEEKIEDM